MLLAFALCLIALPAWSQQEPRDIFPPWNIISPDMLSTRVSTDAKVEQGPALRLDTRLPTVVNLKEVDLSGTAAGTEMNITAQIKPGGDFEGNSHLEIWLYYKNGQIVPLRDAAQSLDVAPAPWDQPVRKISGGPWKDYTLKYVMPQENRPERAIFYLVVAGRGTLWFKSPGIASPDQLATRVAPDLKIKGGPATRIDTRVPTVVSVKEVKLKDRLHNTELNFIATMKSRDFEGKAYLEMQLHYPSGNIIPVRSVQNPLIGSMEWYNFNVSYTLQKGEYPDKILLYLIVNGKGTLWLKSLKLQKNP
jgi:hypothetical protein